MLVIPNEIISLECYIYVYFKKFLVRSPAESAKNLFLASSSCQIAFF